MTVVSTTVSNKVAAANVIALTLSGVPAGALIVATESNEQDQTHLTSITSSPSLTWSNRCQTGLGATSGSADIYDSTFSAGGSITVTATLSASVHWQLVLHVVTGQETTQGGATNSITAQAACNSTNTTTRANSIIFAQASNWNATTGARTYRITSTEPANCYDPDGNYTGLAFYCPVTTATAYTVGITAPSDGANGWSTATYEVRTP